MATDSGLDISEAHVAAYRRDGALLLKSVIAPEYLELIEGSLEEIYATPGDMTSRVTTAAGKGDTLTDQFASLHNAKLARFIAESPAAEIAGRLMASAQAQFVLDQIFYKQKGHVVCTPWHQDTPFLRVRGGDLARVWVCCDPSPRRLTVQVVRGSQRWNVIYRATGSADEDAVAVDVGTRFSYSGEYDSALPELPKIAAYRGSFDIMSWDVEPGDALVFNGNILHGAEGGFDHPTPRRAFASLWAGDDVRYHVSRSHTVPDLAVLKGTLVPHGAPISDYPQIFPVGWRRAAPSFDASQGITP
jgi:ectoine hydroxylase-related dioxygenase (phytanoyl-CoA dioxygenase family)